MTIAAIHIIQIFNIPLAANVEAMKLVDEPSMKKHKNTTGYRAVDIDWVMNVKMSILMIHYTRTTLRVYVNPCCIYHYMGFSPIFNNSTGLQKHRIYCKTERFRSVMILAICMEITPQ